MVTEAVWFVVAELFAVGFGVLLGRTAVLLLIEADGWLGDEELFEPEPVLVAAGDLVVTGVFVVGVVLVAAGAVVAGVVPPSSSSEPSEFDVVLSSHSLNIRLNADCRWISVPSVVVTLHAGSVPEFLSARSSGHFVQKMTLSFFFMGTCITWPLAVSHVSIFLRMPLYAFANVASVQSPLLLAAHVAVVVAASTRSAVVRTARSLMAEAFVVQMTVWRGR